MIGRLRGKILGRKVRSVFVLEEKYVLSFGKRSFDRFRIIRVFGAERPRGARLSARRRADRTDCDPAFLPSEKIITSTGSRVWGYFRRPALMDERKLRRGKRRR